MDITVLIQCVIFIIPIFLATIFAKRYNFLHGFISYFVFVVLIYGSVQLLGFAADNIAAVEDFAEKYEEYASFNTEYSFEVIRSFFSNFGADVIVEGPWIYVIFAVVFVIMQIFSSISRKKRIEREKY